MGVLDSGECTMTDQQHDRTTHSGILLMFVALALAVASYQIPIENTQQSFVFLILFTAAVLIGAKGYRMV